jgi:hypothetical protein
MDGKVQKCDEIVTFQGIFSAFGSLGSSVTWRYLNFESPQPPIVLNAIRNQTSQKIGLELCNIQRRSPGNLGKVGSKFVVQGQIQNRWSEFLETPSNLSPVAELFDGINLNLTCIPGV